MIPCVHFLTAAFSVACGLFLVAVQNAGCASQDHKPGTIAYTSVGTVDTGLLQRVAGFISKDLGMPLQQVSPPRLATDGLTLGKLAEVLLPMSTTNGSALLLVFVDLKGGGEATAAAAKDQSRVVVVNLAPLRPKVADKPAEREQFARRLDRECIRAIGGIFGIQPCLNPRCVMFKHASEKELDAKGRNFCPPCRERFVAALKEKGIQLEKKVPRIPPPLPRKTATQRP